MARLENKFTLEHTRIGENNLEQILLAFSKKAEAEETQVRAEVREVTEGSSDEIVLSDLPAKCAGVLSWIFLR